MNQQQNSIQFLKLTNFGYIASVIGTIMCLWGCDPNYMRNYKIFTYDNALLLNDTIFQSELNAICNKYTGKAGSEASSISAAVIFNCYQMTDIYVDTSYKFGHFSVIQKGTSKYVRIGNGLVPKQTVFYKTLQNDIAAVFKKHNFLLDTIGVKNSDL